MLKKISVLALSMGLTSIVFANDAMTIKAEAVEALVNPPVVEAVQQKDNTVLVSPRTGMRYTVNNPQNVPIIFKTEVATVATAATVNRIAASNPALSTASQEKAQAALLEMVGTNTTAQNVTP